MEVLNDSDFRNGQFDTGFIEKWMKNRIASPPPSQVELDLAVFGAILAAIEKGKSPAELAETGANESPSLWKTVGRRQSLRH
jgi:hypothetical protein